MPVVTCYEHVKAVVLIRHRSALDAGVDLELLSLRAEDSIYSHVRGSTPPPFHKGFAVESQISRPFSP
jgi:hypothetical protein